MKGNLTVKPSLKKITWQKVNANTNEVYAPNQFPVKSQEYIKASLHTEKLKFGNKPSPEQLSIFDVLDEATGKPIADREEDKKLAKELTVIGIENTLAQNKALHAIQTLLSKTNYKGNMPGTNITSPDNAWTFQGFLPALRLTIPEYLDAYGVAKKDKGRGYAEYNSNERKEALQALKALHDKRYLITYSRFNGSYNKQGKPLFDAVRTVRPLIQIIEGYKDLTEQEVDKLHTPSGLKADKITHLAIEPSVVLVDQIESYFAMKPANLYQEIQLTFGRVDKKLPLFIELLTATAAERTRKKEGLTFEYLLETLAYKLRLGYLLETRQHKRLRKQLVKYMDQAKTLGYLEAYSIEQGIGGEKALLKLNENKFYRTQDLIARGEVAASNEE